MGEEEGSGALGELIGATPWVDTHEHLVAEEHRVASGDYHFIDVWGGAECLPADWTALIAHYALDDLVSAGLPPTALQALRDHGRGPVEKWDLVAPYLDLARSTGYLRAVDISTERLFGARLERDTCEAIDGQARELRRPGYYERVLRDVANVACCHVHSLERDPFHDGQESELLRQDLSLVPLVFGRDAAVELASGIEVGSLDDYLDVIEWAFARYGDRAVAVKCLWAYFRPLGVSADHGPPRRSFLRLRRGDADRADRRRVEDFLLRRCISLATEHDLPVKLHLGYLAGNRRPELRWVDRHVRDVVPLTQEHPRTTFVLMHAAWPQQEQLLALAKHQPNVVVDLCWAWILAPIATAEFARRFLTTVPASKLLCFGGDYMTVETVVGHAELARRGLQATLERLVSDGWLTMERALLLVPLLMHANAERIFPPRAQRSA